MVEKRPVNVPPLQALMELEVQVVDYISKEPMASIQYEIELDDGSTRNGQTDENGYIRETGIPPDSYVLKISHQNHHFIFKETEVEESLEQSDESWAPEELGEMISLDNIRQIAS